MPKNFSLKNKYGHEENLSKAIANSETFKELLQRCGATITEEASFEQKVDKGHEGHEGRIDIVQPTSSGIVIIEVQYGRSDNNHARRLENYAANYRKPAFVIWVAESFRTEHKNKFQHSKTPVLCARASLNNDSLILKQASPITWTKQSQSKRIRESNKKCLELMNRLFSNKFVEYKKLESFFQDEGRVRKNTSHIHWEYTGKPKVKGWDYEGLVSSIIDYYFFGLPKKTKFFVLKHPAFLEHKNYLKRKLKDYWEETNKDNDHPYLDYTFLSKSEIRSAKKHSHISRLNVEGKEPQWEFEDEKGLELHRKYNYFAYQKYWNDWHPLTKSIGSRKLLELTELEHLSGFKNKGNSIISYSSKIQTQGDELMAKTFSLEVKEWKTLSVNEQKNACDWHKEICNKWDKEIRKLYKEKESLWRDIYYGKDKSKEKEHDNKSKECDDKVRFYKEEIAKYGRKLMSND